MSRPLPWAKLYTRNLNEAKWRDVPADEYGVFAKLIQLGAVSTKRGVVFGTTAQIAALMGWPLEIVERAITRLSAPPFKTIRSLQTRVVFEKWEEHNPPSNFDPDYAAVRPAPETTENTGVSEDAGYSDSYSLALAPAIAASPSPSLSQDVEVRATNLRAALSSVRGWPTNAELDRMFTIQLATDFPSTDLVREARKFGTWVLDHPFKANSSPRSRFRNWCGNSVKFAARDASRGRPTTLSVEEQLAEKHKRWSA